MELKEAEMDRKEADHLTRREVISRGFFGVVGALIASILPRSRKEMTREEFERNISDREASFYRRLAG
jgi:hypothetical protein